MLDRATTRRWLPRGKADDSPLRGSEFRAIWTAEVQSIVGDQLARIALSVLVYQATGSPLLTAATYALTFLPDAIAGPTLAWIADRYPRRTVMTSCALIQAGWVALMAIPGLPLWTLFACIAGESLAMSVFMAARNAAIGEILQGSDRTVGQGRLTAVRETGQLLGLLAAGGTVAVLGVHIALLLNAASYLITAGLMHWRLQRRAAPGAQHSAVVIVDRDPRRPVLVTYSLLAALTVIPHALVVSLVLELNAPTWAMGMLLAADPLGLAIAARVHCRPGVPRERYQRMIRPLALLCLGAMVLFAATTNIYMAALLLALSGWGAAYQIMAKVEYMNLLPNAVHGRRTGNVRSALRFGQGTCVLLGGAVAEWTGSATMTIAAAGTLGVLVCLGAAVAWQRAHPAMTAAIT